MPTPFHLLWQRSVTQSCDLRSAAGKLGWDETEIRVPEWPAKLDLAAIEASILREGQRPVIICSIQVARRIAARHPGLRPGLIFSPDRLAWNHYSAHAPEGTLLNSRGILLPYAHVPRNLDLVRSAFGDRIFLRPNSALKPFTGLDTTVAAAEQELQALRATEHIDPAELTVVAPWKPLPAVEYRFWVLNGLISDAAPRGAPYSWGEEEVSGPAPDEVVRLANAIAPWAEAHLGDVTADVVMTEEGPRIVEFNAISTSGIYPGVDPVKFLQALASGWA